MRILLLALIVLPMMVSCGKGKNGSDGINGKDGRDGSNGVAGQDAQQIKVVTFCSSGAGAQFEEKGLCIDGKPYAVLSQNGLASLIEVPNGDYVTTDGSSCAFTVNENTCK